MTAFYKDFILFFLFLFSFNFCIAQESITNFLGIPLTGSKSEMIKKLESKGYKKRIGHDDYLFGKFNGRDVVISIVSYKNKVYRILVADEFGTSARKIKAIFNKLCRDFELNRKYFPLSMYSFEISNEVDISSEMETKDVQFEASYLQFPNDYVIDSLFKVAEKALMDKEINKSDYKRELYSTLNFLAKVKYYENVVWFAIVKYNDEYFLNLFYENLLNEPKGEDL